MEIDFNHFHFLKNPKAGQLKENHLAFLATLTVPTVIDITGKDTTRCRVVTTLLHGNEPSGLIAFHQWLLQLNDLTVPETNIRFIICSVEAAQLLPMLSHRYLNEGLDINRCFGQKYTQDYYLRAQLISNAIEEVSPELVVDLHNTSGSGPAFAVCTEVTNHALSIISLFCKNVIVSGIKLGALMEQDFNCPVVTIECGGSQDQQAHHIAFQGIQQIAQIKETKNVANQEVNIIHQPLRLKLRSKVCLSYGLFNSGNSGVILLSSIENTNFNGAGKGQFLGWLDNLGLANLELLDAMNNDVINDYFIAKDNKLICKQSMQIFMATSNKEIAQADCLFYMVKSNS